MGAGPNDLTTINNALAWLGLQQDDAFGTVQRLITAVSAMISGHCGRTFISTSYNITLNGRGRNRIRLPNTPITAVSTVNLVYGYSGTFVIPARLSPGFGQAFTPGYTFDDKFVYLDPPYMFEKGTQNVQISYTGGYSTIPLDLEQACLTWIKAHMDGQNYSAALAKAKAGQTQLDFSFIMTKFQGHTVPMPPAVYAALAQYRRVAPSW